MATKKKPSIISGVKPMASSPGPGQPTGRRVFVKAAAPSATPQTPTFHPTTPAAPAQNPSAPADTTGVSPGDYRDSAYFQGAAAAQQKRDAELAASDAEGAKNLAAKTAALQALQDQQPKDEQNTKESENNQGLFYSGHLGQSLADLAAAYTSKRGATNQAFTDAESARAAARQGIEAGYGSDIAALAAAAADRGTARDQSAAAGGFLAPETGGDAGPAAAPALRAPAAAAPKPGYNFVQDSGPRAGQSYNVVTKNGKKYRFYANGDKVIA